MLHRLAPPGGDYSFRPISVGWIRLLDGTEWVKVSIDSRTETDYGVRLTGSLVDDYGILVLVVHDDIIAGQMRTMRDVFRITTDLRAREFIVTQLDPTRFAQDDLQLPDDTPSETRRNPPFQDDPSSTHDGGSEIRVLVAYTSTLKARRNGLRGVQLLADDLLIGSADAAFMGSDVDADLTLAGLIEVDYVKLGDPNQDLQRLQDDSDGFLDNLHSERDRLDADLVFLIVDERWTVLRDGRHLPVCGDAYTYTGLSSFFRLRIRGVQRRRGVRYDVRARARPSHGTRAQPRRSPARAVSPLRQGVRQPGRLANHHGSPKYPVLGGRSDGVYGTAALLLGSPRRTRRWASARRFLFMTGGCGEVRVSPIWSTPYGLEGARSWRAVRVGDCRRVSCRDAVVCPCRVR